MTRTIPELVLLSLSSRTTKTGWRSTTVCDLVRNGPLPWIREASKSRARAMSPGHRIPPCSCKLHGIHRALSSTLAFRFLFKPRQILQS
ncbi:hypothetical protein AVEN_20562-1 [Araneus ventricosus]|uniref:Uncharacterized protein n=1 Tax=Araneus ventricosus TaxID=182803 RepID=A0A4Y2RJT9_ARAVE|nr:hypothetical protein AVEN_20562-1 [Araneus ventricosus]